MNFDTCISHMVAPGTRRPRKYRQGVIQIHVTRACDKACFACTQGSNLGGKSHFMPVQMFEDAVRSLGFGSSNPYFGVVGVFGGNPAVSPHFEGYCEVLQRHVPFEQRGLWCNNPLSLEKAQLMSKTFDPSVSNLNVHLDRDAYDLFRKGWPTAHIVGLTGDSRHSPVHLAAKDIVRKPDGEPDMERIWDAVSRCDINQNWSAMLAMFRGELRAYFCEVAGAQSILHQDDAGYPDTGVDPAIRSSHGTPWWKWPMGPFAYQVRKHCPECAVPLRGYGELSQAVDGKEVTSETHRSIFRPKRQGREVVVATELTQLGVGKLALTTDYLGNARK